MTDTPHATTRPFKHGTASLTPGGWPHAFSAWLDAAGIRNGDELGKADFDALGDYHARWVCEGDAAKRDYRRAG